MPPRSLTIVCYHAICNSPITVTSPQDRPTRPPTVAEPPPHARDARGSGWQADTSTRIHTPAGLPPPRETAFVRTLPGRLFVLSTVLLVLIFVVQRFGALPDIVEIFRRVVTLAFLGSASWLLAVGIARNRRRLLWRVRRKLILSYVFLGVVPVVLVVAFAAAGAIVLYTSLASYMFRDGLADLTDNIKQIADTSAGEVSRTPDIVQSALTRKYTNLMAQYPALSLAVLPMPNASGDVAVVTAGPWRHVPAPASLPAWVATAHHFEGLVELPPSTDPGHEERLAIRVVSPSPGSDRVVIADLPIDTDIVARLHDRTGAEIDGITVTDAKGSRLLTNAIHPPGGMLSAFRQTVAFVDFTDWVTGQTGRAAIGLNAPAARLYQRLASVPSEGQLSQLNTGFLAVLVVLAIAFLIIQGLALVMGALLARSITYAVHELFIGTERVQQGDFVHRIRIDSRDQLGDLADSFNRMSGSISHLLHVQREKQRMDDELRIAREIQRSLLPVQPPQLAGLDVADLCEPAREVGGDYYDFFEVGPRQLGVLIADVSGKGTSAALYMAELKGLMLALSHAERSPRRLLIDVNRRLVDQLDNRSFITMTYAILDLEAGTLTCARAGHSPLIIVSKGESEILTPPGMVLGLRLPGAVDRFEQMLQEYSQPIAPGDLIVLYTDGITEAMDRQGELFGDAALASVLASHATLDAVGLRERVLREVKAFVGDAEPHDDMTMVILKLDGEAAA